MIMVLMMTMIFVVKSYYILIKKLNSMALVRERTIPTERPPPVGEVSANFCG
jgi:Na+-transporting methylmalonyl-CoA/oxaloacetate decarboxylase gamma subunit